MVRGVSLPHLSLPYPSSPEVTERLVVPRGLPALLHQQLPAHRPRHFQPRPRPTPLQFVMVHRNPKLLQNLGEIKSETVNKTKFNLKQNKQKQNKQKKKKQEQSKHNKTKKKEKKRGETKQKNCFFVAPWMGLPTAKETRGTSIPRNPFTLGTIKPSTTITPSLTLLLKVPSRYPRHFLPLTLCTLDTTLVNFIPPKLPLARPLTFFTVDAVYPMLPLTPYTVDTTPSHRISSTLSSCTRGSC